MFWNISNHPSTGWGEEQIDAAKNIGGEVRDIPFPNVPPSASEAEVAKLAHQLVEEEYFFPAGDHALVQGEFTLVVELIIRLQRAGVACWAATTARETTEKDGVKTSVFKFVRLRRYPELAG